MKRKKRTVLKPYAKIILSFLGVILIGSLLLYLPISSKSGKSLNYLDAFFVTVSATCVTGLTTVPNLGETLSVFGEIIVIILMEFGGLSFLTITVFFALAFRMKLGISESFLMKEALNQESMKDLEKLVVKIVIIALSIQAVGAVANTIILYFYYKDFIKALGYGIFHSVSAFNNSGLDIFGSTSMIEFSHNIPLNIVTMLLIILGGIGFVVIIDIFENKRWKKYSLHTKVTLITTTCLIVFGAILIKCSMWNDLTVLEAIFLSVTCRTAGFTTIDLSNISNACYLVCIFLMFIGASPGSTGGGVKTTTLFLILNFIYFFARGKSPRAFYRKISYKNINKAFSLINFALLFVVLMTLCVSFAEPNIDFKMILFEVVSAFSTTGLSMGITQSLTTFSKLILCLCMFIGRVGPLTLMGLLNNHWVSESKEKITYVEENIMIG